MRIFVALLGIVIGSVGLGIDASIMLPAELTVTPVHPVARSFPDALIYFWTYFTHLTNLGLLLIYVAEISGWRWLAWLRSAQARVIAAGYIMLVMLYYHFMLAPTLTLAGPIGFATFLLHYATPLLYLLWWALFTPHGDLRFRQVPALLIPGLLYVGWALLRGAITGEYPYDILDAGKFGYLQVAIGTGVLVAAVAVFCLVLVFVDRLVARSKT